MAKVMTDKQKQQEKLAEDIRQYFKKGGQVTKLARGESARDKKGQVPMSPFDVGRLRGPSLTFTKEKNNE